MEELIEKAKLAIGNHSLDDYKITPTDFPDNLEKDAPELSTILKHSSFLEKAKRYEHHDDIAINSQYKFKKFAHQATWAICCAAIAGSFLAGLAAANSLLAGLAAAYPWLTYAIKSLLFLLGTVSTVAGGFAVYRLHQIKSDKLLENWMTARAKAETERLGYFNALSRFLVKNRHTDVYLHLLL